MCRRRIKQLAFGNRVAQKGIGSEEVMEMLAIGGAVAGSIGIAFGLQRLLLELWLRAVDPTHRGR